MNYGSITCEPYDTQEELSFDQMSSQSSMIFSQESSDNEYEQQSGIIQDYSNFKLFQEPQNKFKGFKKPNLVRIISSLLTL